MKRTVLAIVTSLAALMSIAQEHSVKPDTILIPERAVFVSGNPTNSHDLVAMIYNQQDWHFSDPQPPRFLFVDRQGRAALGIGGTVKGEVGYYFSGAINDGSNFTTYDIPVPADPAHRQRLYGDVSHSSIFLSMVGRTSKLGYYQVYVQTQFTGDNGGYGVKVKQAWASLGNVTIGLARSSFVDGAAGTPTADTQGPAGEATGKNILVRYAKTFGKGFRVAGSLEIPKVTATANTTNEEIDQRVPDIPVNLQYSWDGGASHVRLTGLFRDMYYRDLINGKNRSSIGWAAQLSGVVDVLGTAQFFYQGAIGRGYGRYINDLEGNGFDLVSSSTPGRMKAPKTMNYELGVRYNATSKLFFAASFSQARLYGIDYLAPDTYKYGRYVSATAFYNLTPDLLCGLEYCNGRRMDISGAHNNANRIEFMMQYSF